MRRMRIMFFAIACCSPFRTFFATALGPSFCVRMKPAENPIHKTVRIRPRPKNKPAKWPVDPPSARYTRVPDRLQPPDCVPDCTDTGHTPRKLPRKTGQSPASSHSTPLLTHRRSVSIPICNHSVKRNFVIFAEIFEDILCSAPKSPGGPRVIFPWAYATIRYPHQKRQLSSIIIWYMQ